MVTLSLSATVKVGALLALVVAGVLLAGQAGFGPGGPSAEASSLHEIRKLLASDGQEYDTFGTSIAIDGDTAIIGAPGNDGGAAYVLQRDAGGVNNWGEIKVLTGTGYFGGSVAIGGDTIVVGASANDSGGVDAGAAFVFDRNAGGTSNWGQVKQLIASDAEPGDRFGVVAVSGSTIVVGATNEDSFGTSSGAAYVFGRDEGGADNWGEVRKLKASDAQAYDGFGAVAIFGDFAIIGAGLEDAGGTQAGAAYVFQRDHGGANNWGETKKLTASDAEPDDFFGSSIAMRGDTAVVSAYRKDAGAVNAGAAYVLGRNVGGIDNWGEVKKLDSSAAQPEGYFGFGVAIAPGVIVVGAPQESGVATSAGAAYAFSQNEGGAGNWGEVQKLTASDSQDYDSLGARVGVAGDIVIAGASGEDTAGFAAGAAYVFNLLELKPTATSTPLIPPTATATPPSTPPPTPCPGDCPKPEMALNVIGGVCNDVNQPTTCDVPVGAQFTLTVEITAAPEQGYVLAQSFIHYGDHLTYTPTLLASDEIVWPDCEAVTAQRAQIDNTNPSLNPTGYTVNHGCFTGLLPPLPVSSFIGDFLRISMTCSNAETTTNVQQLPYTDIFPITSTIQYTSGSAFSFFSGPTQVVVVPNLSDLTINCVQPPPPVGGIALGADTGLRPLEMPESSSNNFSPQAWALAAGAGAVALGGGIWWTRKRLAG